MLLLGALNLIKNRAIVTPETVDHVPAREIANLLNLHLAALASKSGRYRCSTVCDHAVLARARVMVKALLTSNNRGFVASARLASDLPLSQLNQTPTLAGDGQFNGQLAHRILPSRLRLHCRDGTDWYCGGLDSRVWIAA